MKRKAYRVVPKAGSINNLTVVEETLPDPAAHEVRVAVRTIGLNFADIFAVFGLYSATPEGSFIPGLEYSGVVDAVGDEVEALKVGDAVMGVSRFGAYTTHLNIDARYVFPLPGSWDFAEGAGFLVQALTAYYALFPLGAMSRGDTVLVHSAAGGVGIQAVRLIKKYDGFVVGTIGSEHKRAVLEREGVDRIIVRDLNTFDHQLATALEGKPLNLVLDSIGGKILMSSYQALAPMGRLITYGSARYAHPGDKPNFLKLAWKYITRPKIDPQAMTNENKGVLAFNLIWLYEKTELMQELVGELMAMQLPAPHVGHRFGWTDLPDALRKFLEGQTTGKVVVEL